MKEVRSTQVTGNGSEPRAPQLDDELAVRGRNGYVMTADRIRALWAKKQPVALPEDPALRAVLEAHREVLVARDVRYAAMAGHEGINRVIAAITEVMDRIRDEVEIYRPIYEEACKAPGANARIGDVAELTEEDLEAAANRDAAYVQAATLSSALALVVSIREDLQDEAEAMAIAETIAEAKHSEALARLQRAGRKAA